MKWTRVFRFVLAVFVVSLVTFVSPSLTHSQTAPAESDAASSCPLVIHQFRPWEIRAHVENTSGKTIVGLTFYVALADATEHWKWLHYNFDDSRPRHEFGWNKPLKPGAEKTLWWNRDVDFDRGGGGAFVLSSVLFEDGSTWEEATDYSSCKFLWYNHHKKSFSRPVELPPRMQ
jgi:hypothetical protein